MFMNEIDLQFSDFFLVSFSDLGTQIIIHHKIICGVFLFSFSQKFKYIIRLICFFLMLAQAWIKGMIFVQFIVM